MLVVFMGRADAYIDPGSGSFLIQLLIGGLLVGGFALKMGWRRVCAFVARLVGKKEHAKQESHAERAEPAERAEKRTEDGEE
jgi:hypothetical protein